MQKSILVAYATRFGSTEEVAAFIADTLRQNGLTLDCRPMAEVQSFDGYEAALLGSAVNYAAWLPAAVDFVKAHREALNRVPVALFTVHIQNINDDEASRQARLVSRQARTASP